MQSLIVNEDGINQFFNGLNDSGHRLDFENFKKIVRL